MGISEISKKMFVCCTLIWGVITLAAVVLISAGAEVCEHFSFDVLLEFARAVDLWYIIAAGCACAIDISSKKRR